MRDDPPAGDTAGPPPAGDTAGPPPAGDTAGPLAVAVDATPLLGHPTGVGEFCAGVLGGLAGHPGVRVSAFAVSWRRRRGIEPQLPPEVRAVRRAMPARPLHWAWRRADVPPLEWFTGPVDVVHGTNFVAPPTRRAARVLTVHDLTTVRFPELCDGPTLAYPALIRRAVQRGAWVHTPSAFVAGEVVAELGAAPERVVAVHSGVPGLAPPDHGAPRRFRPPGTERYVLAVGTAEPRKDLPGLVQAFNELAGERDDLALVLAGPDGWGTAALERAVGASPFRARVVRAGWVDGPTLSGLLSGAAVLAYPSVYEGFGFPPLQAMAAGIPVVATRAGAVPEVVDEAALLVPTGDPAALAGALARVLDNEEVTTGLVARGRRRAEQFTWDRTARGLLALYRRAQR